jgi:hypothetical protein
VDAVFELDSDVPAEWHTSETMAEWEKLVNAVTRASTQHEQNPNHPLVQIGSFEALATRGVGGFGVVFEVRDPGLDRHVALKLSKVTGPAAARALTREARKLARLSHPNIVTIHGLGLHGDDPFFVMEYVDGCTVLEWSSRRPRPTWVQTIEVFLGAARGLAAAHDEGLIHGDFKPANVLLDARNHDRPRVADFGFARSVSEQDPDPDRVLSRRVAGTPAYMAPEALSGKRCDALADQFSFWVSLWQALDGGKMPFEGHSSAEILDSILHRGPQAFDPKVPANVRAKMLVGLSIEPSARYSDMHVVAAELERLLQTRRGWARERSPWLAIGIVAWFVGATVLGVLGWIERPRVEYREVPTPPEPPPLDAAEPPCALGDESVDLDSTVVEVCQLIRDGQFKLADGGWYAEFLDRLNRDAPGLGAHTLIVARTFVEQAEEIRQTSPEQAKAAALIARTWVLQAAALLGELRVEDVKDRAEAIAPPASSSG